MYLQLVLWSSQQRQTLQTNNQAELKSGSAKSTSFATVEDVVTGSMYSYISFCSAKIHLFILQ